jgi:hypothetical protein
MVWYGNDPKNKSIQDIILVELENFDLRHFENYNI